MAIKGSGLMDLFRFIRSHHFGRTAHTVTGTDVLELLKCFVDDARLDRRWRELTLIPAIRKIERKREAWAERKAGLKPMTMSLDRFAKLD